MDSNSFKLIQEWHQLLKEGLISEDDFAKKKAELLGIPIKEQEKNIPNPLVGGVEPSSAHIGHGKVINEPNTSKQDSEISDVIKILPFEDSGSSIEKAKRRQWLMVSVASLLFLGAISALSYFFYFKEKMVKESTTPQTIATVVDSATADPQTNDAIVDSASADTEIKPPGQYIVSSSKAYFNDTPDGTDRRSAYLVNGDIVNVQSVKNGFGYVQFTNEKGITSIGWIKMTELIARYPF